MKTIIIILIVISMYCSTDNGLPGASFSLFNDTPVEELANAVKKQDVDQIELLLTNGDIDINYQEEKSQKTLLMLAVVHNLDKSVKKLLEAGADPNIRDKKDYSSIMLACNNVYANTCKTDILKLLIEHGGDVNGFRLNEPRKYNFFGETLLMIAVRDASNNPCNERAYLLVEKGADINMIVRDSNCCAVNSALMVDNLDMVNYFLIEKNAKIPPYVLIRVDGDTVSVRQILEESNFTDDSHRNKLKNELLKFLETKGY